MYSLIPGGGGAWDNFGSDGSATGFLEPLLYFRLFCGQLQNFVLVTFAQIWFYDQSLSVTFLTPNLPIF